MTKSPPQRYSLKLEGSGEVCDIKFAVGIHIMRRHDPPRVVSFLCHLKWLQAITKELDHGSRVVTVSKEGEKIHEHS